MVVCDAGVLETEVDSTLMELEVGGVASVLLVDNRTDDTDAGVVETEEDWT